MPSLHMLDFRRWRVWSRSPPLFESEASDSELGSRQHERMAADDMAAARIRHQLASARSTGRWSWVRTSVIPLFATIPLFALSMKLFDESLNETEDRVRSTWLRTFAWGVLVVGSQTGLLSVPPTSFKLGCIFAVVSALAAGAVSAVFAMVTARLADGVVREPVCMATHVLLVPFAANLGLTLIGATLCITLIDAVVRTILGRCQDRLESQWTCCGLEAFSARRLVDQIWQIMGDSWTRAWLLGAYGIYAKWGDAPAYDFESDLLQLAAIAWGATFSLSCRVRARVHAWLTWRGEEVNTAAGIAALLGEIEPAAAVVAGMARLRAIRADKLTRRVMDPPGEAKPGANKREWYEQSRPVLVDSVDAFVSHSWYDPPDAKWAALQSWRRAFVAAKGREPMLWFDRCCIDQDDVVADLPLLPFYVASSRHFLILAGATYLSRLWCVTELFVFAEMHAGVQQKGEESALDPVVMLTIPGISLEHIEGFHVADARCALRADYDRLLDCVEAACGTLPAFDARARSLLASAGGWHVGDEASNPRPSMLQNVRGSSIRSRRLSAQSSESLAPPAASSSWLRALGLLRGCAFSYAHVVVVFVVCVLWSSAPARSDCRACASSLAALPAERVAGWVEHGGAQYKLRAERLSLADARRACEADGGALLAPLGADELQLVRCLTSERLGPSLEGPWLAAPADGAGAFTAWAPGQPNLEASASEAERDASGEELCVYLWPDGLRTRQCSTKATSLCKRSDVAAIAAQVPLVTPTETEAVPSPSQSTVDDRAGQP